MERHTEQFLDKAQFGFRKNRSTRDAIGASRNVGELVMNMNREICICICFIDYVEAFDRVSWGNVFPLLQQIGCPQQILRLIYNLYGNQSEIIRLNAHYVRTSKNKQEYNKAVFCCHV